MRARTRRVFALLALLAACAACASDESELTTSGLEVNRRSDIGTNDNGPATTLPTAATDGPATTEMAASDPAKLAVVPPQKAATSSDTSVPAPTAPPTTRARKTATTAPARPTTTQSVATTAPPPPPTTAAPPPQTTPPPTEPAPPPAGDADTGEGLPRGDLPQWHQVFIEDFSTDVPTGGFPGSAYDSRWNVYDDGWKDTAAKNEGTSSRYFPSRVISVSNGILTKRLHTEDGTTMVAAIMPDVGDLTYGRFSVRFRADEVPGFKTAWLLWPQYEWPRDGEVDFPEAGLNEHINAYMHRTGATNGSDQDAYTTNARFNDWHTATIEWAPSDMKFILDGVVIGHSTSRVPANPMHWVLQTETCMNGCQPSPSAVANVQIDWVTVYTLN